MSDLLQTLRERPLPLAKTLGIEFTALARYFIGRDTAMAMRSGPASAICLGTSSPTITDSAVIEATTIATDSDSAIGATSGISASTGTSRSLKVAPP